MTGYILLRRKNPRSQRQTKRKPQRQRPPVITHRRRLRPTTWIKEAAGAADWIVWKQCGVQLGPGPFLSGIVSLLIFLPLNVAASTGSVARLSTTTVQLVSQQVSSSLSLLTRGSECVPGVVLLGEGRKRFGNRQLFLEQNESTRKRASDSNRPG